MVCSNASLSSGGELSWVLFAPQREQRKLTKHARQVLSLCSGCDRAVESIVPKGALSYLRGISADVTLVTCSLGE